MHTVQWFPLINLECEDTARHYPLYAFAYMYDHDMMQM